MSRNEPHSLQVTPTQDEAARQRFALGLKRALGGRFRPLRRERFEAKGQPCENPDAVAAVMANDAADALWQSLNRAAQAGMWAAVAATLERGEHEMRDKARALSAGNPRGSLTLDPDFVAPAYIATHIHLQPGGYGLDRDPADLMAGALYEAGGAVYSAGQGIGTGQSKAEIATHWLRAQYPGFTPRRILDIGTSAGASATPYARLFADAEVHAIDMSAGLLRYAHARAEALGVAVHFHQMRADDIRFPDGHFDLIVSHNLLHEIPREIAAGMYRECRRLLGLGGITLHQDVPLRIADMDPFRQWDVSWDLHNNNEPFWLDFGATDQKAALAAAGFSRDSIFDGYLTQNDGSMRWYAAGARKEAS